MFKIGEQRSTVSKVHTTDTLFEARPHFIKSKLCAWTQLTHKMFTQAETAIQKRLEKWLLMPRYTQVFNHETWNAP